MSACSTAAKEREEKLVAVPQGASSLIGRQRARKQRSKKGIQIPFTGRSQCAERPNVRRGESTVRYMLMQRCNQYAFTD
jgi:hypothetical protein